MSLPWRRWLLPGLLALGGAGALWLLWQSVGPLLSDVEGLRRWVAGLGGWGLIGLVLVQVAQILVAPVPGYPIVIVGGLLFGGFWGGLGSTVGMMLGAALAGGLARRFGRPMLERFVANSELERWEHLILNDSPWYWFLVVLLPTGEVPYFLAGLSRVSFPAFLLGLLVARGPAMFVISTFTARAIEIPVAWRLGLALPLLALGALLFWRRQVIMAWAENLLRPNPPK